MGKHAQEDLDLNAKMVSFDGNEAAAYVAYRLSEVCAIYPITPSSTMAELADEWAARDIPNIWGHIPTVVEMQHEGGAAGAVHGALQAGALSTTFTASQGLMLMLPNMYKIAGELTPTVFHVAARSLAAQGLSIFGDHQDVMAARTTGFAQLASATVQEAHDLALVAHAVTLQSRIPFLHFFDGFRTSHEVNKIHCLEDDTIRKIVDHDLVLAHLDKARESVNSYYEAVPGIVQQKMDELAAETGRSYQLFDYFGDPEADSIVISMGSGSSTVRETVEWLNRNGNSRYGGIVVRLFRPFCFEAMLGALPKSAQRIAVLDRTKEPGSNGEPLFQDVMTALAQALSDGRIEAMPLVCGGRYGLSSKEFTPAMVKAVFDNLESDAPKRKFTVGIQDDITHLSLEIEPGFNIESDQVVRAMFYGLGSDGTVGANKNSIKIIGADPDRYGQAYFVYDSKKSGAQTVSHLRFGPNPIDSPYLVQSANFIGCHQFEFVFSGDILEKAADGSTLLLNSPYGPDELWDKLPERMQQQIAERNIRLYTIDAYQVAGDTGMGRRINTIMQVCFFKLAGVMDTDTAIAKIKEAIAKTYRKKGDKVIQMNYAAVDQALSHLFEVKIDAAKRSGIGERPVVPEIAPIFVQDVTAEMIAGRGDQLPVSKLPVDGTYPTATTQWEKRSIAQNIPEWLDDNCIQCGNCSFVCPHAAIRAKFCHENELADAPESFQSAKISARGFPEMRYVLQVYPDDCTGCNLCVDACPVRETDEQGEEVRALRLVERTLGDRLFKRPWRAVPAAAV
jgi:pyruvate-ferredoxin/flavodoxin oxidoreductase